MKSGDKFIIELGEKIKIQKESSLGEWALSDEVYEVKGTGAAISVKDLQNLEEYKKRPSVPLEDIEKMAYEQGLNEAWEIAKKISTMGYKESVKIFGDKYEGAEFWENYSASEAIEKIKEYDKEIKVGDEVIFDRDNPLITIVTCIKYYDKEAHDYTVMASNGMMWDFVMPSEIKKTGKHYDEAERIFKNLKESEKGEIPFL